MLLLKEKVSVHVVSLHLAPGISLGLGKNNRSNSALKHTGEIEKAIKPWESAMVSISCSK